MPGPHGGAENLERLIHQVREDLSARTCLAGFLRNFLKINFEREMIDCHGA